MQAIVTKFHGPTDFRGSRITARAAAGRVTLPWRYHLDIAGNHTAAAEALARKLGWDGHWVAGGLPSEDGFVFVNALAPHDGAFKLARHGDALCREI